jgi:hypothetical protein
MDDRESDPMAEQPITPAEAALLDDLRRIVNSSEYAGRRPIGRVPCLFTMPLDQPGRVEWCRIDAGRPHHFHVSANGVYRWTDDGALIPTPHIASPAFAKLYQDDPEGQKPWETARDGGNVYDGGVGLYDPPEGVRGFAAFAFRWRAYQNLPVLHRRLRRLSLTAGFVLGLVITVAVICAVMLAVLILVWFMLAYFSEWLTT